MARKRVDEPRALLKELLDEGADPEGVSEVLDALLEWHALPLPPGVAPVLEVVDGPIILGLLKASTEVGGAGQRAISNMSRWVRKLANNLRGISEPKDEKKRRRRVNRARRVRERSTG